MLSTLKPADRIKARYIPKDATEHKDAESSAVVYLYASANGRCYAIAYSGSAMRSAWHYAYRTEDARAANVARFFESVRSSERAKKERAAARRAYRHTYQPGDVLVSSWGYEQTNVDFYVVVRVPGPSTVVLRAASLRGRAHDVLWMASLALRGAFARGDDRARFEVLLPRAETRQRLQCLYAVADGDGVTVGFPEDF